MNRTAARSCSSLALAAAILIVAAVLRLWALGSLPPGLYRDEAYNGLDALNILRGNLSLYFAANNGREPLFMYLIAASVSALGRTPLAARLPAAFASLLTVPATYQMACALGNKRLGLISAALLAVMLWPVHLAHVSFRAGLLPLLLALTVWQAARGWRTHNKWRWIAAGILYGVSFYTYLAARFTPLVIGLVALYAWFAFLRRDGAARRRALQGAGWFSAAALLVALPLLLYTCTHWDIVMGRVGQASIFNPDINGGNLPGALAGNTLKALGMFFVRGDRIYRHNVPWRPVFDPIVGACFIAGVLMALQRLRRNASAALAIAWTVIMLLPTILAEDTPHFLRGVGVLPVIVIFPALALDAIARRTAGRWIVTGVLLLSLSSTAYDYFVRYPQDPKTAYWFDAAGVSMAQEANAMLEAGGRVSIDRRLWDDWVNLRFMVNEQNVHLIEADQRPAPVSNQPLSLWLVWPYQDLSRWWEALPPRVQVEVQEGALYQGDKDPEPHMAYLYFRTAPYGDLPSPRARFEQFVQLLDARATPVNGRVRVRLVWYAEYAVVQPLMVFVHLMQDSQRIAQGDGPPANGYYPSEAWRPGDVIVDEHWTDKANLKGGEQVIVGVYNPITGQRLNVLDAAGNPIADSVEVTVESGK